MYVGSLKGTHKAVKIFLREDTQKQLFLEMAQASFWTTGDSVILKAFVKVIPSSKISSGIEETLHDFATEGNSPTKFPLLHGYRVKVTTPPTCQERGKLTGGRAEHEASDTPPQHHRALPYKRLTKTRTAHGALRLTEEQQERGRLRPTEPTRGSREDRAEGMPRAAYRPRAGQGSGFSAAGVAGAAGDPALAARVYNRVMSLARAPYKVSTR